MDIQELLEVIHVVTSIVITFLATSFMWIWFFHKDNDYKGDKIKEQHNKLVKLHKRVKELEKELANRDQGCILLAVEWQHT